MTVMPKYQDEVYNTRGEAGAYNISKARDAGYKWITSATGTIFPVDDYSWTARTGLNLSDLKVRNTPPVVEDKPRSKQDVWDVPGQGADQARIEAQQRGKLWFSDYYGFVYATKDIQPVMASVTRQLNIKELPDKAETFEERVLSFVNDPKRSDRNSLYASLAQRHFFSKNSEEKQIRVVRDMLETSAWCPEGKQRFRDHMGDMLPDVKQKVTLTVEFDNSKYQEDAVVGVISRYVKGQFGAEVTQ